VRHAFDLADQPGELGGILRESFRAEDDDADDEQDEELPPIDVERRFTPSLHRR